MKSFSFGALVIVSLAFAGAPANAQSSVLIKNGRLHTMAGADRSQVIENADILITGGAIAAIGPGLEAPADATVVDAGGRPVTPGLFAPWSQLGLAEIGLDAEANDASPQGDFIFSAALDARDAFNPQHTLIPINRAGGVTRALVAPTPGRALFGGQAIVVDLSGSSQSVTRAGVAQSVLLGYAGASRAGDTRLGAWALLREQFDEALSYAANPRDFVQRERDATISLRDLRALAPVVAGNQTLIVSVNGAQEILSLIDLKSRYRLKVVILGGAEAWKVSRELAAARIPVILNPVDNLPGQFEELGATLKNAARLHEAGVIIGFHGTASGSHNLRLLTQLAGNAVANGLPHHAALAALTLNPAIMYGLDARLGSLEPGKIADIVIWEGDPLEVSTQPVAVFIEGRPMSLDNRQQALRDRYRDLTRGDLPFVYRGQ